MVLSETMKFIIGSVIVPLVCAGMGALAGFFGCKYKYTQKNIEKTKMNAKARDVSGNNVQNSHDVNIG